MVNKFYGQFYAHLRNEEELCYDSEEDRLLNERENKND